MTEQISASIKGIFISTENGQHLISYSNDPKLQTELLSAFISGLFLFGRESVGKIDEISIKGLGIEVMVVYKHSLILTALFSTDMVKKDLRGEAEQVLDLFNTKYCHTLEKWNGCVDDFTEFQTTLIQQIQQYFSKINDATGENKKETESFWAKIIRKLKS